MAAFKIEAFRPLEEFKREVTEFVQYVKSSAPAAGFQEVLYPGELEHRTTQRRLKDGIEVEDATWQQLRDLATEYAVADELEFDSNGA